MRERIPSSFRPLVTLFSLLVINLGGCPPTTPLPPLPIPTVAVVPVAQGLTSPVTMASPSDASGRLFIVDQIGVIRILGADGTLLAAPFLDVSDRLQPLFAGGDERGLLGLAFHPQYASNGRFFIDYVAPKGPDVPVDFDSEIHISEFRVSANNADTADPASERILLRVPKPQSNHNGGTVLFGPDGFLYISTGDGGSGSDIGFGHNPTIGNGQDKSTLLGKILRIDVNGAQPYAIPPDNPFATTAGAAPEVWAYGLRNPYRFSFDRGGEHRLFVGDVGQALFEEVDIVTRGGNYGWRVREGNVCFDPLDAGTPPAACPTTGPDGSTLISPIIAYGHTTPTGAPGGVAVVGGHVYRGQAFAGLVGRYVFGDLTTGLPLDGLLFVATEQADGTWVHEELVVAGTPNGRLGRLVLGFGEDSAGELYVLTNQPGAPTGATGVVFRLVPAP